MISGQATAAGTHRYRARFTRLAPGHFRQTQELQVSSIGFGTSPGEDDEATDKRYSAALERALQLGCNVIDTAARYRNQCSERMIGKTVTRVISAGEFQRDEIVISTKAGYVPFDGAYASEVRRYFEDTFLKPGIFSAADVVGGGHCLAPKFLRHQIESSRRNLNCATIDLYFLHDPELQLQFVSRQEFHARLLVAFEVLEQAVAEGKITMYGTATWSGYRTSPEAKEYLSLTTLRQCAREVGGQNHHFRAVMLPLNLALPEAFTYRNQWLAEGEEPIALLPAAQAYGMLVMLSSSLHQGRLAQGGSAHGFSLPDGRPATAAQRALQFARSAPGGTVALTGTSNRAHVAENMALGSIQPFAAGEFREHYVSVCVGST